MIRTMTKADFIAFWPTFEAVILAQETYAFDPNMTCEQAYIMWCESALASYVYEENSKILGSYYLKANGMGPSSHISNCGYMVSELARGKGIASALCEHSQHIAIELGFTAMQYNSVVSSNEVAIKLWEKLGYKIIGTIPQAYRHGTLGYIDSYIMHKQLVPPTFTR
ncbi:GNAT family N-acetyltransferase [Pseudoalteromonas sp. MSK9-3]|uniref:GNAT family N-acetyltransferase n=1 Tax=Pseudoalteromonas sp. MSK9-3 TaxID=1897633 RepID=UPI000E6CB15E|nr:GNAT family N-acetyltransferase [Pseudoalteromonas sp. MSK9-3]RJE73304.1 GNAT family N-acetyltransferase [Pseudoalteromonas sp. MSK9-3]